MAVHKITKRVVDVLSTTKHHDYLWDEDLPGFGVRVTASGFKSYVAQYRMPGIGRRGSAKRITLGSHGALTPEEARRLAKRELGKVAQGGDPLSDRNARKNAPKVSELGKDYLKDVEAHRKKGTHTEYTRLWAKHVLPAIGTKAVADVSAQDMRKLHTSMKKTPYLANRVAAMLGAFFTFAETEDVRPRHTNPAHTIEFFPETPRERFLTPAEFKRLGEALAKAETTGLPAAIHRKPGKTEKRKHVPKTLKPVRAHPSAVAAIRLLALTGCRESEILSLRWDAVDLERGYLRLADSKTGKSVRPLGATAAALLDALPRVEDNPYVLPGEKEKEHIKEIKRVWYAVRQAAKLDEVRLHDLRHSFASVPANSGESLLVVRSLLGHKRVATTERYAHLGDDPVKRAADRASEDIGSWMK